MDDWAHDWTDVEIERLKRRMTEEFSVAKYEMAEKMERFLEEHEKKRLEWLSKVAAGVETKEEYEAWLKRRALDVAWYEDMIDTLADAAVNADREAMMLINDLIPGVFAENANYSAYSVEMGLGYNTHSFDLYDRDTVRLLLSEERELLPPIPEPRLNEMKDKIWNRQKFTSAVTQSILQGESITNAARRMMTVFDMDRNAAFRAARTAITGAENAGRVHSYRRAKSIGIDIEQEWLATLDTRTRHSHRLLDGTHVPVGEKFRTENGELEFPGDPNCEDASEVYNCRCTLVPWFPWMEEEEIPERWSRLPEAMTYAEWKEATATDRKESYKNKSKTVGAKFYESVSRRNKRGGK